MPGFPIALIEDKTVHNGQLQPPVPPPPRYGTVLINGRPPVLVGSLHICPVDAEFVQPNVVLPDPRLIARPVLIHGRPVAAVGTPTTCTAVIAPKIGTVTVGGTP